MFISFKLTDERCEVTPSKRFSLCLNITIEIPKQGKK